MRALLLLILLAPLAAPAAQGCGASGIALQVLGSGGPIADDARAASGYLLWQDGRARVLVDAGGGVFQRFGATGARLEDLDLLALTHMHTDHASDLPALLKGGYFSPRTRALPVSGPSGNELMPPVGGFLDAMFHPERGAFRYLSGFLDGTGGLFPLRPVEVDAGGDRPATVLSAEGLEVRAVGVHHGPIPTLSYLFVIDGERIALGGDQNTTRGTFAALARGADLMVMPMAIPEGAGDAARNLHATPSQVGRAAAAAGPGELVLSHLMARSLRDLASNVDRVRAHYPGPVTVAEDLGCFPVTPGDDG